MQCYNVILEGVILDERIKIYQINKDRKYAFSRKFSYSEFHTTCIKFEKYYRHSIVRFSVLRVILHRIKCIDT